MAIKSTIKAIGKTSIKGKHIMDLARASSVTTISTVGDLHLAMDMA